MPTSGRSFMEYQKSFLDPRTKLLLLLVLPTFLLSEAGGDYFLPIRIILSTLPFIFLLVSGQYKAAFKGLSVILGVALAWHFLAPHLPPVLYILMLIIYGIAVHLIPGLLMAVYVLTTTKASEFIAAMERMHVPPTVTIPLSVIFRFFPTVIEEARSIGRAMSMRGVGPLGTQPGKVIEYRIVPTIMCSLKTGDELSAAALSRGLGSPKKRTSLYPLQFHIQDVLVFTLCGLIIIFWILSKVGIFLW